MDVICPLKKAKRIFSIIFVCVQSTRKIMLNWKAVAMLLVNQCMIQAYKMHVPNMKCMHIWEILMWDFLPNIYLGVRPINRFGKWICTKRTHLHICIAMSDGCPVYTRFNFSTGIIDFEGKINKYNHNQVYLLITLSLLSSFRFLY